MRYCQRSLGQCAFGWKQDNVNKVCSQRGESREGEGGILQTRGNKSQEREEENQGRITKSRTSLCLLSDECFQLVGMEREESWLLSVLHAGWSRFPLWWGNNNTSLFPPKLTRVHESVTFEIIWTLGLSPEAFSWKRFNVRMNRRWRTLQNAQRPACYGKSTSVHTSGQRKPAGNQLFMLWNVFILGLKCSGFKIQLLVFIPSGNVEIQVSCVKAF